jgi:hypothetical protein
MVSNTVGELNIFGDMRKHARFVIKLQWKMKSTRESWFGKNYNFLLLAHEHLFIFRKLGEGESKKKFKHSVGWHSP